MMVDDLIVDDLIDKEIQPELLPKVKVGFIHEDYKTGAKFIYIRGSKIKEPRKEEVKT